MASNRANRFGRFLLLFGVSALLSLGCMGRRGHQPVEEEPAAAFRPVERRHIRLLDAADEQFGAFHVSRRAAQVLDAQGVPLARARRLHDRVEVLDRGANVVLVIRGELAAEDGAGRIGNLELADGSGVGQFVVEQGQNVILYGPAPGRLQRGEVIVSEGDETVRVFGAPGTDLVAQITRTGPREVVLTDGEGSSIARLIGEDLEPWILGALCLQSPLTGEHSEAFYRVGTLVYLMGF